MNSRTALALCLAIVLVTGTVAAFLSVPRLLPASELPALSSLPAASAAAVPAGRTTVLYTAGTGTAAQADRVAVIGGDVYYVRSLVVRAGAAVTADEEAPSLSLAPGARQFHRETVGDWAARLRVDLDWGDPSLDPSLLVYPPDGTVLDPYRDLDDGQRDGRCYLEIGGSERTLTPGDWYFRVTGDPNRTVPRFTLETAAGVA